MTFRGRRNWALQLAVILAAGTVAACGGTPAPTLEAAQSQAQQNPAQPVSLVNSNPTAVTTNTPTARPIDQARVAKAVDRFRINSGSEPAVLQIAGADLDSDGTTEALVHLSGEGWCQPAGCSLLVMRPGPTGYDVVTLIKDVQLPVGVSPQSTVGWRDLMISTGQPGATRLVALKFNGNTYPALAGSQPPIPAADVISPEIVLRPTLASAKPAPIAGSNLIAGQN